MSYRPLHNLSAHASVYFMDNPPEHWDIAIIGTGLSESILSAALAKAGKKVLHLDENDYYGADSASLTVDELLRWADARSAVSNSESQYLIQQRRTFTDVSYSFPSSEDPSTKNATLLKESRSYAISLMPCLVPATGPIIDSLIGSGVSRYGGFVLLTAVAVCSKIEGEWKMRRMPSSKEDVFKDREMSLIEKRRLMRFLMFAGGEFEESGEYIGHEDEPILEYLRMRFSLSSSVSAGIAFAIAHCSTSDAKVSAAMPRLRRYLKSTGRYGNSPFLIGHYGGAGEIAQGFCRTAAVKGATYILGRTITSIEQIGEAPAPPSILSPQHMEGGMPTGPHYSIRLDGFANPVTAEIVVASPSYRHLLSPSPDAAPGASVVVSRCIAIIDGPISFPQNTHVDETGDANAPAGQANDTTNVLVVFPPDGNNGPVSALILGDTSMSCPIGKQVVYLTHVSPQTGSPDPRNLFVPYLECLSPSKPLFALYYNQLIDPSPLYDVPPSSSTYVISSDPCPTAPLTESADEAAREAERVFNEVRRYLGEGLSDGDEGEFWANEGEDIQEGQDDEW